MRENTFGFLDQFVPDGAGEHSEPTGPGDGHRQVGIRDSADTGLLERMPTVEHLGEAGRDGHACIVARGRIAPQQMRESVGYGSMGPPPPGWISKCKCGPVELPVEPTFPMTSPGATWRGAPTYWDRW